MPDPKPKRRWYQFSLRMLLLGLLIFLGCGASKDQQAIDAVSRGVDHGKKGEHDKAIAEFTEAIRLNPEYAPAYAYRGGAWSMKGEYEKAVVDCTEAIRLDPKMPQPYSNRAYAWNKQGRWLERQSPDRRNKP